MHAPIARSRAVIANMRKPGAEIETCASVFRTTLGCGGTGDGFLARFWLGDLPRVTTFGELQPHLAGGGSCANLARSLLWVEYRPKGCDGHEAVKRLVGNPA